MELPSMTTSCSDSLASCRKASSALQLAALNTEFCILNSFRRWCFELRKSKSNGQPELAFASVRNSRSGFVYRLGLCSTFLPSWQFNIKLTARWLKRGVAFSSVLKLVNEILPSTFRFLILGFVGAEI